MLRLALVTLVAISATATAGTLHATIVDGQTLQPIAHATARIGDRDIAVGEHGELALETDHPVDVVAAAPGYEPATQTVSEDDTLVLLFRTGALDEVIEVHGAATARDGAYILTRDEIRGMPGASNDALAAVRSLPGITSAPAVAAGRLVIRGGAPQDSLLEIDGVPVPFVYHAFDNTTILPVAMIGAMTYSPGGFGVEEGRATSGAVGITTNDEAPLRAGGQASLSLLDAQANAATPLGHGVTLSGGVRRSTVDLLIPFAMPDNVMIGFTTPPRYYDGQLKLDWTVSTHDRVALLALTSFDRLGIVNEMPDSDLPADFSTNAKFGRLIASWKHEVPGVRNQLVAALGDGELHARYDAIQHLDATDTLAMLRDDASVDLGSRVRVRGGGFASVAHDDIDARSVLVPADGLPPGHFNDLPIKTIATGVDANYAAAYAAADVRPTASTTLTAGARLEYFGHIHAIVPEPRVELAQRAGQMTLHAAAGIYARDPSQLEGIPTNLAPERATQISGGTDVELGQGLVATASVYHTARSSLAVEDPTQMTAADVLPYASSGSGSSGGVDLMLRYHGEHAFGWLAYSFGTSSRREAPGDALHATPFDQTHTLTAVGSYTFGAWQVGGRFQYASGLPYTDIVGATMVDGHYLPTLGTPYGARYPDVAELDLRVEHAWKTKYGKLAGFIDVMNVFRDARIERYTYSADFSSRTPLTQYVPLPSIGIRGEI
jgi:hypothetical protein